MPEESPPTLNDYIVAYCRIRVGRQPDPEHVRWAAAFSSNPALVLEAQTERDRLASMNAVKELFKRDYQARTRHEALTDMLNTYEVSQ